MGSIQILLGKTRVRRRRAVARSELSGVDRHGVPNFLYVTDTLRKAETVRSEFVRYRDGASFVPTVVTLSRLLADLATRHGDGRTIWSPGGAALVAERLIAAEAGSFPWLAALGDPERVGRAAATLAQEWDEADRPVLDARPELTRFLARLLDALASDRARRPHGDALRQLVGALEWPSESLGQWLARHHAVVVDDVLHPSPLRRRVLVALARAWRTRGAHVVLAFESGRDLGGAEVAGFFDYQDDDAVAFPLRPFQATRAFRRALFEALVAEGGEADLVVVGSDGVARTVDPGDEPGDPEPADLADRLYADAPEDLAAEPPPRAPRLVRFSDPAAEVRAIAHAVKERLLGGASPEDVWVAFPGLPGYLPLVRRTFEGLGIPYEVSAGRPVRARPVAELLVVAARSAAEGHPLGPLLAALASGLVGAVSESDALALARACRERGLSRGHPASWGSRLAEAERARHAGAIEALGALCTRLAPLARPIAPAAWRDLLAEVVEEWEVVTRAGASEDPAVRAASLGAVGRVLAALQQAADDATAVDPGPWDPIRLARLLDEQLQAAQLPDPEAGPARVQVVGMLELRGVHPAWLWVGGLLADDFPARPPEDFLLSRVARRALDGLDPGDEARYLFASTLRNALAEGQSLTLSWPATRDDRPVAVSPLVEDLLEVPFGGRPLRTAVEAGVVPRVPAGPPELDALLGEAAATGADAGAWAAFAAAPERLARIAEVVSARRDPEGFGPWDGVLHRAPPVPERLGVTRFEEYLACPSRYFHRALLGLAAEGAWDPDLPRSDQGRLLHAVLEDFLKRVREDGLPHLRGLDGDARARWARVLHEVGTARLDGDPLVTGLLRPLSDWHRRRWLAGLVDDAPMGLLSAWLDAEIASELPTTLDRAELPFRGYAVGPIALEGRVDRVDRIEGGGSLVLDYKTGRAPAADDVRAGVKIQGVVYLDAVAGGTGAAVYQELRGADALAMAGWVGDPETLAELGVPEKRAVALGPEERAALTAHLAASGERLERGVFHPSLAGPDRAGCGWCEFHRSCRVDHVRNAALAARGDPRWQAPLLPADETDEEGE